MKKNIIILYLLTIRFASANDELDYRYHYFPIADQQIAAYHLALENYPEFASMFVKESMNNYNAYHKFTLLNNIIYNPTSLGLNSSNGLNSTIINFITSKMVNRESVIIWANNRDIMESLKLRLEKEKIKTITIFNDGDFDSTQYIYAVEALNSKKIDVLLTNYQFTNTLNLLSVSYLIAHIPGQVGVLNPLIRNFRSSHRSGYRPTVEFMLPDISDNVILEFLKYVMLHDKSNYKKFDNIYEDIFKKLQVNREDTCSASLRSLF